MNIFLNTLMVLFNFKSLFLILLGVIVGLIFGAIPGLTATIAIALFLPMTFSMNSLQGISLLMGLYIGGISGGLIPAILLNIPGTPASVATTFDGYPMCKKGMATKALGTGILFSFLSGVFSIIVLILVSPSLSKLALKFSSYEYFAISIFSLTLIATLSGKSLTKGLLSGLIGLSLALIGMAPIDAFPRFTFGFDSLNNGFDLLPALTGLFTLPQLIKSISSKNNSYNLENKTSLKIKGFGITLSEFTAQMGNFIRSSIIGLVIGILPGIGASSSNILAYAAAKKRSKYPSKFGTGIIDGVVASESGNNSSIGGALIPLLTLGIPGDAVTALLLGGLMIHGLTPGPLLFKTNPEIVYAVFISQIIGNIFMLIIALLGINFIVKLLKIPKNILFPIITCLCMTGCYALNNRVFDIWVFIFFGLLGCFLNYFEFPIPPIILGFILGPIAETNLRRGLMLSKNSFVPFVTRPFCAIFLIFTLISVISTFVQKTNKKQST